MIVANANTLTIEEIKEAIDEAINNYEWPERVKRVGVFGSVARGDTSKGSDLDLLLDFEYIITSRDFEELDAEISKERALENSLFKTFNPISLSIVTVAGLEDNRGYADIAFKERVYKDVIWIYE